MNLKRVLVGAFLGVIGGSSLQGTEAIALVYRVIRMVEVTHQAAVYRVDRPGYRLFEGDRVHTGPRDRAVILFANGVWVKMNTNTLLEIRERSDRKVRLHLNLGEIWSKLRKGRAELEIETPVAVATVRGTEFYLRVTPDTVFQLLVLEGEVEVRTKTATFLVGPMTAVELRRGERPRLKHVKEAQLPRWDAELGGAGAILVEEESSPPPEREGVLEIEHKGKISRIRIRLVRQ